MILFGLLDYFLWVIGLFSLAYWTTFFGLTDYFLWIIGLVPLDYWDYIFSE